MKATGRIISVVPSKKTYELNDEVWLTVEATTTYYPDHDWSGCWNTYYRVFNVHGREIAGEVRNHAITPWTGEDHADETVSLKCGKVTASDIFTVKLQWQSIAFPILDQYVPLDEKKVNVWVTEQVRPEPPVNGEDIIPIPPVNGEDIIPIPPPPINGDEERPWWEEWFNEENVKKYLPWVAVAGAVILLLPKGKNKSKGGLLSS